MSLLIGGNISAGGGGYSSSRGEKGTHLIYGGRGERGRTPPCGGRANTHTAVRKDGGGGGDDRPGPPNGGRSRTLPGFGGFGGVTRTFHVVLLDVLLIAEAIRPPVLGLQEGGWLGGGGGHQGGGAACHAPPLPPAPPPAAPQPFPVLTHLEQAGGRSHGAQQLGHPGAVVGPQFWGGG